MPAAPGREMQDMGSLRNGGHSVMANGFYSRIFLRGICLVCQDADFNGSRGICLIFIKSNKSNKINGLRRKMGQKGLKWRPWRIKSGCLYAEFRAQRGLKYFRTREKCLYTRFRLVKCPWLEELTHLVYRSISKTEDKFEKYGYVTTENNKKRYEKHLIGPFSWNKVV